jgi:uncharacterized membrane protein YsdA (DUF1294 family)
MNELPKSRFREKRNGWFSAGIFFALLLLPALALFRLSPKIDPLCTGGYSVLISIFTLLLYWKDKRRAQSGGWRTPESLLHTAEALGGWPGAYLAQRMIRHKISKLRYQVVFWLIVLTYQVVALNFILDWRWSGRVLAWIYSK